MKKIPNNAKCVFKGIIFDTYQWEQKLYNGKIKTFEMLKRPDTVNIIPMQNGFVYYAEEKQPPLNETYVGLLGGRVKQNEKLEKAALRELKEEAGIISSKVSLFKKVKPVGKLDWSIYFYITSDFHFAETEFDGGEQIKLKKSKIDDFIDNIILNNSIRKGNILTMWLPIYAEELRKALKNYSKK